jgi:phosphate-selective porin
VLGALACAASPGLAQTVSTPEAARTPAIVTSSAAPAETPPGWHWDFSGSPSLRYRDTFRFDFRTRAHWDAWWLDPIPDGAEEDNEWSMARFGIEGYLFKVLEYEVTYDFVDDESPWKDVFLNLRVWDEAQVMAGHFKVPFGRERLQGITQLDFVNRALVSRDLAPGRDTGGMVHGRTKRRGFSYALGYFIGEPDGSIGKIDAPEVDGPIQPSLEATEPMWAGRAVVRPFALADKNGWFESAEVGVDFMTADLPEGRFGVRGRSLYGPTYFDRVYTKGRRLGYGVDGGLTTGPISVQAEYLRVTDGRENQGIGDETLPDLVGHGWWVAGTWVVTGQNKSRADNPKHWFPLKGVGAIEVAMRYEELRFKSASTAGEEPYRNPRAANLYPNSDTAWTTGINWYPNRWVKVQYNAIRETIEDIERTLLAGEDTFWSNTVRVQLLF